MVLSKVVTPEAGDADLLETEAETVETIIRLIEKIEEEDGFLGIVDQKYLEKLVKKRSELFEKRVDQMMVRFI